MNNLKRIILNPDLAHIALETLQKDFGMTMNIELEKLSPDEKSKILFEILKSIVEVDKEVGVA